MLAYRYFKPHVIFFLYLRSTFGCTHPSHCSPCCPTQLYGLEDGASRRWCFLKMVSMLGWCTPSQLPAGMETLLCWNSDVILCLDPLVKFIIMLCFCSKHWFVSLYRRRMYEKTHPGIHVMCIRFCFMKPGVTPSTWRNTLLLWSVGLYWLSYDIACVLRGSPTYLI